MKIDSIKIKQKYDVQTHDWIFFFLFFFSSLFSFCRGRVGVGREGGGGVN